MQFANELELAHAFAQSGQLALWLGESWRALGDREELAAIAAKDWIGVWSEAGDPTLATSMAKLWSDQRRPREVVEVPDTLPEVLGADFRYADFCPYMYLNGRADRDDPLDDITRSDSRVDKIRQLGRLQSGILLIAGAPGPVDALKTVAQAGVRADQLRRIVVLGFSHGELEQPYSEFQLKHRALSGKAAFWPGQLTELINRLATLESPGEDVAVRLGGTVVPLAPLLRQEPPVTQDYAILTTRDVAPMAQPDENDAELLARLLSGTGLPWRSIARGFSWDGRPEHALWRMRLTEAIDTVSEGTKKIVVVDFDVEAGSGATVLLSQLAVYAASRNCPTMFHLAADCEQSYPRLRTFLTDLYRDQAAPDANLPAVIFFDVDSGWADVNGHLETLPGRLHRDGRRAVLVRARQIGRTTVARKRKSKPTREVDYVQVEQPLREHLSDQSSLALAKWLEGQFQRLDAGALPPMWFAQLRSLSSASGCPLLIAISLLLPDHFRAVARLGDRVVARLERAVQALEAQRSDHSAAHDVADNRPLIDSIRIGLACGAPTSVEKGHLYSLVIVLAAFGCIRMSVPRRVLAHLAGINPADILTTVVSLERAGLALSRNSAASDNAYSASMRFCTSAGAVQLVHHEYGRLFLESVSSTPTTVPLPSCVGIAGAVLDEVKAAIEAGELGRNALGLLKPVFLHLRPGDEDDRAFAEQLVQRFLRVQREKGLDAAEHREFADEERSFRRWQWQNRHMILSCFEWVPRALLQSSASILHSRAITSAKCTYDEDPNQARPLYTSAEDDLIAALELEGESRSDNPVHMLSTLGMVYVHWARMERRYGDAARVPELDELAEKTLREAQSLQLDSAYPAYHLAVHKIDTAEYLLGLDSAAAREGAANHIAEALELLSGEPEPNFRVEWDELFARAVRLLGENGEAVVEQLKRERNILGWALAALRELNGEFPRQRDVELKEGWLASAERILNEGFSQPGIVPTPIAHLLRYAVFSFCAAREQDPAFDVRLQFLRPVVPSRYFDDGPVWQFDYGMLCYQNGEYEEGAKTFRELRRGQKYFYVSNDRAVSLTEGPNSLTPREFTLQVQSIDNRTGQGWARIARPRPFPDPVPFTVRAFESRGIRMPIRATRPCHITIRPAGPFAEPVIKR